MQANIRGTAGFSYLAVTLGTNESIIAESDAMSTMSADLSMSTGFNGGLFGGLARKFLGKESLFINTFKNDTDGPREVTLVQPYPGAMRCIDLKGQTLFLQPGAFIACEPTVKLSLKWAGLASFIGREGLFRLAVTGEGRCWYGAYGALLERELHGEAIVDTSHLVAYDPTVKLHVQLAGGIFSSFFGGEGLVTRLSGEGNYVVQTRSLESLSGWLNPKFW